MIVNYNILECEIMDVPYEKKWAKNKVLFVEYDLCDEDSYISSKFVTLAEMGKKNSGSTVGDRIFETIRMNHTDWLCEVFVDRESVLTRIDELNGKLKKRPELALLAAMLIRSGKHLPKRSEIGYSL